MPHAASPSGTANSGPADRGAWLSTIRGIALDAVPPLLIFYLLHALGVPDVLAYLAGSIVPLARLVADRVRRSPFNVISALVAVWLLVSVVLALTTGDARAVIARGGVIYLALALAAIASVPTRKPLMLLLSRYFAVRARPGTAERFDDAFQQPRALRAMRRVTAVWAVAFAVSGAACVVCAYVLPVTAAAAVNALLEPVIALILAAGTARYMRRTMTSAATEMSAPETTGHDAPRTSS